MNKSKKPKISAIMLAEFPTVGFIRQSELIPDILPFSSATLWRKVSKGEFPKPIKLSKNITAWPRKVIAEYLDNLTDQPAVA